MNTVPGTCSMLRGGPAVQVGSGTWPLAKGARTPAAGQQVVVGVRPEHLLARPGDADEGAAAGPAGTVDGVNGVIVAAEWLGHERHLICDVEGARVIVREPSGDVDPAPGRPVHLHALPDAIHLFDESSGERLS